MILTTKTILRKEILERRKQISPELMAIRSQQLCQVIRNFIRKHGSFTELASFRSFRGEPILEAFEKTWPSHIYYPRIDNLSHSMDFYRAPREKSLVMNRFGIEEPPLGEPLLLASSRTLMLVPALAFDHRGYRLGYGLGFYDRYLPHFPGCTIGVCFEEFRLDGLPLAEHDQAVKYVATESAIY